MNAVEFATAVAKRLDAIAPNGWSVWVEGQMVTCGADPTKGGYSDGPFFIPETRDLTIEEMIASAECAMANLQESVLESTGELWPGGPRPHQHVDVDPDQMVLWYGDSASRYLECEPIDLGL
ncbi:MAG TPA: hypothetical protein VGZ03_01005 [Acidimicrobiales bacterium]|jgi:hypothetical protein|nr:hypothetical protein [Acidimicrobiales bacterium]